MQEVNQREIIRASARAYEGTLALSQRKRLGQFFTGIPLGKLLAHLALDADTHTVLDPMAGNGDLLDATWEAACERGISLNRLDGIEIDDITAGVCRNRLAKTIPTNIPKQKILSGDALTLSTIKALSLPMYDLVITNPPYVRYQLLKENGTDSKKIRSNLQQIIANYLSGVEGKIWETLVAGYSGLSDLLIPAWLLASLLVRPGGRLALVVPAAWRSRDYADVVRYLLLRCFALEYIVEDTQPGWFSDALVRTHLIVARRLTTEQASVPVNVRRTLPLAKWLQISPEAANGISLVGAAFQAECPEASLITWLNTQSNTRDGINVYPFDLQYEKNALAAKTAQHHWHHKLESDRNLPLFSNITDHGQVVIPDIFREIFADNPSLKTLSTLDAAGIHVGQGLRTGCNQFFYVTALSTPCNNGMTHIKTSSSFGNLTLRVPTDVLRPVLHRQSEINYLQKGHTPSGRVLDLRRWILPEDAPAAIAASAAYAACGEAVPQVMLDELAAFVRLASAYSLDKTDDSRLIPRLSAVRTNVREARNESIPPSFWYMLPDFTPRHLPSAFVARINHDVPWIEHNLNPPVVIDANFSTFWSSDSNWTRFAIKALLNSTWCRAVMETLGTPFGGGALKLEATHIKQMPIPILSLDNRRKLDALGKKLTADSNEVLAKIDMIILSAMLPDTTGIAVSKLTKIVVGQTHHMRNARQRIAS